MEGWLTGQPEGLCIRAIPSHGYCTNVVIAKIDPPLSVDVEDKLLAFVRWHGEIPPDAHRITDDEAAMHSASWVRRNLGVGTVSAYVIGFELGDSWWTLFFDRMREASATSIVEVWKIDSYNNRGPSWERRFWYWPDGRWQQVSPRDALQREDSSHRADR